MSAVPHRFDARPWIIALLLAFFCGFTFFAKYEFRYGPRPYIFYGDAMTGLPVSDAVTWNLHALNLIEGRGFGDYIKQFRASNYIPPGHPVILGFFYYLLGEDPEKVGWAIAIMGSLLPWLAYLWAREMWGRRVGLIAAGLTAIHLPYIHTGFSLMSEPTTIFTTAVALWLGARFLRQPTAARAAAAGLAFGAFALVRPSALAFLWGVAVVVPALPGCTWRRRGLLAAALVAAALIPLGAWQARNARVHGQASAVYSSISARHAWTGAHPKYGPWFYSRSIWHETLWRDPWASEMTMIRRLQREADEFIRADRRRYLMSCFWRMKVLTPEFNERGAYIKWTPSGWGRIHFMLLAALALGGLFTSFSVNTRLGPAHATTERSGRFWTASLLVGLVIAVFGAGMYGASDRYRWPLEYLAIPFAALFINALLRLGRSPLFEPHVLESGWRRAPRFLRGAQVAGGAALAGLIAAYALHLAAVYRHPPRTEELAPRVTVAQVQSAMERNGLAEEFASQTPAWIAYDEVFAEQAAHYGALESLNGQLVVWWGRLRFVRRDGAGSTDSGYIILEPCPGDFGGARLSFLRVNGVPPDRNFFRDGDIVTLVARLAYEGRPLEMPSLQVYAVLAGRFAPPAPGAGKEHTPP